MLFNLGVSTSAVGVLAATTKESTTTRRRHNSCHGAVVANERHEIGETLIKLGSIITNVISCLSAFSFMACMTFFNQITKISTTPAPCSRPALAQEAKASWMYVGSCFTFASVGIFQIISNQMLADFHPTVSWHFEGYLFVIQSLLSYMSDVTTLGQASKWHPADRLFATTLGAHQLFKVASLIPKIGMFCGVGFIGCVIGAFCLRTGFGHWTQGNAEFINYHVLWHMVFPVFVLGQYYVALPDLFHNNDAVMAHVTEWLYLN